MRCEFSRSAYFQIMRIENKITPDNDIRALLPLTDSRDGLLTLARRSYLSFDYVALGACIEKYESLYYDDAVREYRWLMETSCW